MYHDLVERTGTSTVSLGNLVFNLLNCRRHEIPLSFLLVVHRYRSTEGTYAGHLYKGLYRFLRSQRDVMHGA